MAADDSASSSPERASATTLLLHEGSITFIAPAGGTEAVPADCLKRSQVLQDVLDSTDSAAEAEVPVTPAALQLWISYCKNAAPPRHGDASADPQPLGQAVSHAGRSDSRSAATTDVQEACMLLTVADVLVDDTTRDACARAIADMMLPPRFWSRPHAGQEPAGAACVQAVEALPEHLQLSIFSLAPLPNCLTHLPPSMHPAALRAHYPSIDAHATLALHRLPIAAVHAALAAAATFTALRALSLAGLTLPLDAAPCMHHLRALTSLTALNLHDIGLRQPAADALAVVLPTLRQLESLDLSSNHITGRTVQALAPALRQCTGLRALNLWHTLSMASTDGNIAAALAAALTPLQMLTSVAIGVYTCTPGSNVSRAPNHLERPALVKALVQLPQVKNLELDLFSALSDTSSHRAEDLLSEIGHLTQLQSLHCTVPPLRGQRTIPFSGGHELTSLQLDIIAGSQDIARHAAPSAGSQLARLSTLTQLRRLWLRAPMNVDQDMMMRIPCGVLSEVLQRMSHLRHLELRTAPVGYNDEARLRMDVVNVGEAIDVALAMPQLRILHVPVLATDDRLQWVVDTLLPLRGMQLSVDLTMRVLDVNLLTAVGALARLFPYVETLDVLCQCTEDVGMLAPLIDETTALSNLRALRFGARLRHAAIDRPVVALLESVSCLTRLCSLEISFQETGLLQCAETRSCELQGFMQGLKSLQGLTRLSFEVPVDEGMSLHEDLLQACQRLPDLQALELAGFVQWNEELCQEMLPGLPLRVLHVPITSHSVEDDPLGLPEGWVQRPPSWALTPCVCRRLEHLRCLVQSEWYDNDEWLVHMCTGQLPAFQACGLLDRPYSFEGRGVFQGTRDPL